MSYHPNSLALLTTAHTALISDICDARDLPNPMVSPTIQRVVGSQGRIVVGPAYPCWVEPTDEYVEIDTLLEMVGSIPRGFVPFVASIEGFPAALWGGLMSVGALYRGAQGAVTTGAIRDIDQITEVGFDVFGTGRTALDIRRRGFMREYDVAVEVEGRRIEPGDVVIADGNGVAVIAAHLVDSIADECDRRLDGERATFTGLEEGTHPRELYSDLGEF